MHVADFDNFVKIPIAFQLYILDNEKINKYNKYSPDYTDYESLTHICSYLNVMYQFEHFQKKKVSLHSFCG